MPAKTITKRVAGWLLVVVLVLLLIWFMDEFGIEWSSEAIIQALAGLGGLGYWAYRSSSRVTARLAVKYGFTASLYIENVGNRVAKQVRVECDPPIPIEEREDKVRLFGPVEDFGDMDRGQCYRVPIVMGQEQVDSVIERSTFKVSHESTWGFRRRKSTIRFGGSAERYTQEDAATSLEAMARELSSIDRKIRRG